MPPTVATLLAVAIAAGLSVGGLFLTHSLIPHGLRSAHNDVAGFMLAIVGVIYAVLLAFIAIAVWQSYSSADDLVQTEANLVDDLYRGTISLPPELAGKLRQDLFDYTETVTRQEWPLMTTSMPARIPGWLALDHFHIRLVGLQPKDSPTLAAQTAMLQLLNKLYDVRRGRFHAAESNLPAIVWWNLLAGAVILMAFSSLFGTPRVGMHVVMVGLLGSSIGLVLMLIVLLDNPFVGRSHVSVQPFDSLTRAVETMDFPHPNQ